jgi:hypothetical protein
MPWPTIDYDFITTITNVIDHTIFGIKLRTVLIEVGNLQVGT